MNHEERNFLKTILKMMTYRSEMIAVGRGNSYKEAELAALTYVLNRIEEMEAQDGCQEEDS